MAVTPNLPVTDAVGEVEVYPESILDTRMHYLENGDPITEWLIQWRNLDVYEANWSMLCTFLDNFLISVCKM